MKTKYSVVIPVLNEEKNVLPLYKEIISVLGDKQTEIIFVDDGSTDKTREKIKKTKAKFIFFRKNFGQTAAIDAGIKQANGKYIITLDGDLQNDPNDIPKMEKYLNKHDLDFVCGWRKNRKDSFSKRFISKGAGFLRKYLVNDQIHDSGCTLRIYKKECFADVNLRGEMHRFIPAILRWRGFKLGEIPVHHRPRIHGHSKYNIKRTIKGFVDMINLWFSRKYSTRPLHFFGSLGVLLFLFGLTLGVVLFIARFWGNYSLSDKIWPLVSVFLILFGFQMFVSGLLMDRVIDSSSDKYYFIKESNTS